MVTNPLPSYDAWKLAGPPELTGEQEAEMAEIAQEIEDDFREAIAATLSDCRRDIYLVDIHRIVIEELNKINPRAGEPAWQTATPVPIPGLG